MHAAILTLLGPMLSVVQGPIPMRDDAALADALRGVPALAAAMEHAADHRIQVLLASVEKDPRGQFVLARRGFRVDAEYFYPASSIKLCAAVAALEDLDERRVKDARLTEDTPLEFHPLFEGEAIESTDVGHLKDGTITLRQEIRKVFLVSDNAAFNRLYEFVGQDGLARRAANWGLAGARIVHRLSESRSEDENRRVPRIDFVVSESEHVTIPERTSKLKIVDSRATGIRVGTAYVEGQQVIDKPMSFARKNAIDLVGLQDALVKLVDPDVMLRGEPYAITKPQREFLLNAAAEYPGDSRDPRYPRAEYPDDWGKFLLPGLERVAPKSAWRIVNKIGRAYGFSVENAWVVHRPSGRALFVTATIYTNDNGVLNDGKYEYENVADPFLAALGESVGRELAR